MIFQKIRNIDGMLLVDKPKGLSSNAVLQKVKKIYNAEHAGHTGTLDPLATGMLSICFGKATKFTQYLSNLDKHYHVIACLGQRTDTADSEGKIINTKYSFYFSKEKLNTILNNFQGKKLQIPSMYSALKYKGIPLYKYARKGIVINRIPRSIIIYQVRLIYCKNNLLGLSIHCSKGTYIRTIIDSIGEKLGCGAHVIMLRRLRISFYTSNQMIQLTKLQNIFKKNNYQIDNYLISIKKISIFLPTIYLSYQEFLKFKKYKKINIYNNLNGLVRLVVGKEKKLLGIAKIDKQKNLHLYHLFY